MKVNQKEEDPVGLKLTSTLLCPMTLMTSYWRLPRKQLENLNTIKRKRKTCQSMTKKHHKNKKVARKINNNTQLDQYRRCHQLQKPLKLIIPHHYHKITRQQRQSQSTSQFQNLCSTGKFRKSQTQGCVFYQNVIPGKSKY